jgi:hypothetical protein
MNITTNEVVTAAWLERLPMEERASYIPVPEHLSKAAHRVLGHSQSAHVPRSSKSPLAKWAAEKRRKRRQMERASRRANR